MRLSHLSLLIGPAVLWVAAAAPGSKAATDYKTDILPLLTKYCGGCHGAKVGPGGVTLTALQSESSFKSEHDMWERIAKNLANKHMPPAGMPAPSDAERARIVSFIKNSLGSETPNPGRVTLRRLNRAEYNNTVRDLFGIDIRPAADFPSDDVGYGFDNIGDVLSMSPLLMEKYLKAGQDIAQAVIYTPSVRTWHVQGADLQGQESVVIDDGSKCLFTDGTLYADLNLPVDGDYKVTIVAYQDKAGDADAKMSVTRGKETLSSPDISGKRGNPQTVEVNFHAPAGMARIGASFLNDYYRAKTATDPGEDRNLYVKSIEVTGPIGASNKVPASESRIIFVQPTPTTRVQCERKILGALASKAYRRPATTAEVDKLVSIAELAHNHGDSFEAGIQLGITAVLCSPNFLFHVEKPIGGILSSYEMASRLSYFLWSSMPDDQLFGLAAKNQLQNPVVLQQQVDRMLKDPKSSALADDFAGQWLQTRKLSVVRPDRRLFPGYTDAVRRAMETETKMFFQDIVQNDRSVLDFIDGKYGFLNAPLAQFYGIQADLGPQFKRVEMPPERAGILTQGSVLVVTSNPTRTSPVKRGKWILENILGTPPPPPPPGVGVLKDDKASSENLTLKQRMEQHRKDPACSSCHLGMDGLGFALENFNAVGSWRTKDGPFDVDASGTLPDGSAFTGPAELRAILMKRKVQFVRCLSEKLLTYALGRGLESYDDMAVDKIVRQVSNKDYKFAALIDAVVVSDPFRKSRVEK